MRGVNRWLHWMALAATLFLWGTAFPAIRAVLPAFSPVSVVLGRFLVASVCLALVASAVRLPLPSRRDVPALAALGLTGVIVYHVALNYGLRSVSAGPGSMLVNTAPVFTAVLAAAVLREPISLRGWVGLAVSLSGAAMIGLGEAKGLHFAPGALLILVSAVAWAVNIVAQKPLLRRYTAFQVTCWSIWIGTAPLLVFLPQLAAQVMRAPAAATAGLAYLGALPIGLAYVTWSYALSRLEASRAASFLYVVPVVATIVGWAWLGETPRPFSIAGGLLALGGVAIVNANRPAPPRTAAGS